MLRHIEATDICENCHFEFADHNYVPDSIDVYLCPHERQTSFGYGYGYDRSRPDLYSCDAESCSQQEMLNHKAALDHYHKCKHFGDQFVCPPGSWGIGSYWSMEQTQFKLLLPVDDSQGELDFD